MVADIFAQPNNFQQFIYDWFQEAIISFQLFSWSNVQGSDKIFQIKFPEISLNFSSHKIFPWPIFNTE